MIASQSNNVNYILAQKQSGLCAGCPLHHNLSHTGFPHPTGGGPDFHIKEAGKQSLQHSSLATEKSKQERHKGKYEGDSTWSTGSSPAASGHIFLLPFSGRVAGLPAEPGKQWMLLAKHAILHTHAHTPHISKECMLFPFAAQEEDIMNMEDPEMQQSCAPVCTSPATYDPEKCMCVEKKPTGTLSKCSSGYRRGQIGGVCLCATSLALQCPTGYQLDQSQNCMCTDIRSGHMVSSSCPKESYRPSGKTCYCLHLEDTLCSNSNQELSSNQCTCDTLELSTPQCSVPDLCIWDSQRCSCTST